MKIQMTFILCCFYLCSFAQDTAKILPVKFQNAGVTLDGSIFLPVHPIAAVVLVHGSGRESRMNGLAAELANRGIAVLTYDKRGAGSSGGTYVGPEVGTNNVDTANLKLLATDVNAATEALRKQLGGKRTKVGLVGFSQAAWVIPLAAQKDRKVNFMVLFSGPVATTLEQLRFQFYTNGDTKFWDTHTPADARQHIEHDPDKYQFAPTDPREALGNLSIPGLWLYGGRDIQAPVALSTERLDILIAKGKPYQYHLFPELGHNTAFARSKEPVTLAVQWIIDVAGPGKK